MQIKRPNQLTNKFSKEEVEDIATALKEVRLYIDRHGRADKLAYCMHVFPRWQREAVREHIIRKLSFRGWEAYFNNDESEGFTITLKAQDRFRDVEVSDDEDGFGSSEDSLIGDLHDFSSNEANIHYGLETDNE